MFPRVHLCHFHDFHFSPADQNKSTGFVISLGKTSVFVIVGVLSVLSKNLGSKVHRTIDTLLELVNLVNPTCLEKWLVVTDTNRFLNTMLVLVLGDLHIPFRQVSWILED